MRIKVFIVTYNDADKLNLNLESLFDNVGPVIQNTSVQVNIINNHSNFHINEKFRDKVTVYHNDIRPDWSCGHLARSWNQAIINGFKDLNNPGCDILVTCQDDVVWCENWFQHLVSVHKIFNFYTCSWGDAFLSYTPEAIKNIGIWDERFCNIGYQEADYYFRALNYNKDASSINDTGSGRILNHWKRTTGEIFPGPGLVHNWMDYEKDFIANRTTVDMRMERSVASMPYHQISRRVFELKWPGIATEHWPDEMRTIKDLLPAIPTFMTYPYFELAIPNRHIKGYVQ